MIFPLSLRFFPHFADRCRGTNGRIDAFFDAVVQATDEAVINVLFANETMTGRDGHVVEAMPREAVLAMLTEFERI